MGLWDKFKAGLKKTSSSLESAFTFAKLDEETINQIEEALILTDMGQTVSRELMDQLVKQKPQNEEQAKQIIYQKTKEIMDPCALSFEISPQKPFVVLMVGVNGTGKTTTIGKLASQYKSQGFKVAMAGADTFRMSAIEQLQEWGKKVNCPVYTSQRGADPASTAYDAYTQSIKNKDDILFIDTAGRLQNKTELMAELEKIIRVIKKINPLAPHATLLTLDATTGQNALMQVQAFQNSTHINGLIMSKLDGTAKGGILVALAKQFQLPIYFVGMGENIDDLLTFNVDTYIKNLIGLNE